jgi:hypothetical protein
MNSHQTKSQNPLKNIPKNKIMIGVDLLEVHLYSKPDIKFWLSATNWATTYHNM